MSSQVRVDESISALRIIGAVESRDDEESRINLGLFITLFSHCHDYFSTHAQPIMVQGGRSSEQPHQAKRYAVMEARPCDAYLFLFVIMLLNGGTDVNEGCS